MTRAWNVGTGRMGMRNPAIPVPDSLILIDKPAGMTSHDVVDRIRRFVRPMKVGHTGTLDPFATGLLPLCLGRATRLSRFLSLSDKGYEGLIELGVRTATYDCDGNVLSRSKVPEGWQESVAKIFKKLPGIVKLIPPPFSAKKVMGRPLYEFARADIHIKRKPIETRILDIQLLEFLEKGFRFRAEVSAGTYLRSLADSIGLEIGCGAHLKELRRISSGPLRIDQAIPLVQLEDRIEEDPEQFPSLVVPLQEIPLGLKTLTVNAQGRAAILHGRCFGPAGLNRTAEPSPTPYYRIEDGATGNLLGIAETLTGHSQLPRSLWKPILVFPPQTIAQTRRGPDLQASAGRAGPGEQELN
ncbi:MAG: tRNA pseudouridine(55) synthase TruB [Acidobacteria bacterium]|nr:tRNA pseudouridine(55) synthase TruB [Acidobacteriota bacterium]